MHLGVDPRVAALELLAHPDEGERALEAGREAGCEQLLGVGALAVAAELLRRPDPDVELAVGRPRAAIGAAALHVRLRRVEHLACHRVYLAIARAITTRWISLVPS